MGILKTQSDHNIHQTALSFQNFLVEAYAYNPHPTACMRATKLPLLYMKMECVFKIISKTQKKTSIISILTNFSWRYGAHSKHVAKMFIFLYKK